MALEVTKVYNDYTIRAYIMPGTVDFKVEAPSGGAVYTKTEVVPANIDTEVAAIITAIDAMVTNAGLVQTEYNLY